MTESNEAKRERFVTTTFPDVSIEHNPELPWMVLRAKTADGGRVIEVKLPREDPQMAG